MHICNNNIVRRVSHHQIICLEGLNIIQLLSGGYSTSKLSVLHEGLNIVQLLSGGYSTSNLFVLRVKIPKW